MKKIILALLSLTVGQVALADPNYDPDRRELEWIMGRLIEWLPGAWDSYPQVYYERTQGAPEEGEHDHWHRVFARIDAPQVGDVVFYGQIQTEGRDGPMLRRTQIIYKAWIDEERGAVIINGQPPADEERFVDLHEHPELWDEVRMRDESQINCNFLWHRDGQQIVGLLEGKTPEKQKYGRGTCNYWSEEVEAEFYADAEWVLGPDLLWIYDVNSFDGERFIGREDQTHVRLYRARPFTCEVTDAAGTKLLNAHDRGFETSVAGKNGKELSLLLLRGEFPDPAGTGLTEQLRLILQGADETEMLASTGAEPAATEVSLEAQSVTAKCSIAAEFPPLAEADG